MALTEHASLIAGEVLATEYGPEVATGDAPEHAEHRTRPAVLAQARLGARLLGSLVRLVREAGAAGGAADFPGGAEGHLLQVVLTHEADEDALSVVIPGDAGDHGYF